MHTDAQRIDIDLAGSVPQRVVANRYGLSLAAVNRHKLNHLPASLVAVTVTSATTTPGAELGPRADLLDRLEWLVVGAEQFLEVARGTGNAHTGLAAIREVRATLELLAKITGQLNERPVVVINLETSAEWQAMRRALSEALHRHPGALAEVRDALRLEPPG